MFPCSKWEAVTHELHENRLSGKTLHPSCWSLVLQKTTANLQGGKSMRCWSSNYLKESSGRALHWLSSCYRGTANLAHWLPSLQTIEKIGPWEILPFRIVWVLPLLNSTYHIQPSNSGRSQNSFKSEHMCNILDLMRQAYILFLRVSSVEWGIEIRRHKLLQSSVFTTLCNYSRISPRSFCCGYP